MGMHFVAHNAPHPHMRRKRSAADVGRRGVVDRAVALSAQSTMSDCEGFPPLLCRKSPHQLSQQLCRSDSGTEVHFRYREISLYA
jgi:hypothetical protein